MNNQIKTKYNVALWVGVTSIIVVALGAYYYYAHVMALHTRVLLLLVNIALAGFIVSKTAIGITFIKFWNLALIELKKVVWPNKQEIISSTIAVFVMVFITSLSLAIMDLALSKLLKFLLGGF